MSMRIKHRDFVKRFIDQSIRLALGQLRGQPRELFLEMLVEVQTRSALLRPWQNPGRVEPGSFDPILNGLLGLFQFRKDWLRAVETWEPPEQRPQAMFSSLAHHLLASYPVPRVMLKAWFLGIPWPAQQHQRRFIHISQGGSLRKAGFPIPMSRKMAHEFAHAPAHFAINFALRWSQIRALGGSDELARAVAATRLSERFGNEEFWVSFFHFLINHPKLDLARIDSIVEYFFHQKFESQRFLIGEDTEIAFDPPQPDLSIKGWSVSSLLRRVEEWQALPKDSGMERKLIRWNRSTIGGFHGQDESGLTWTIRELLDSDQLAAEGKAMDHCVAEYTLACSKQTSTIWSVAIEKEPGRYERAATVEVNPETRAIVQSCARSNDDPDDACLAIIERWASQENIQVPAQPTEEPAPPVEIPSAIDPDPEPVQSLVFDVTIPAFTPVWQCSTGSVC